MKPKDTLFYPKKTLKTGGKLLDLSRPLVMGILNVTPDSFYDGGVYTDESKILERAGQILADGASFIDIGAYSSRPEADHISEEEERSRLIPALKSIIREYPDAIISVDTFRASIAEEVVNEGASLINDISGGELDKRMFETISRLQVPYILMHMKGTVQTMTENSQYEDMLPELIDYFQKKTNILNNLGVKDVIIDPGFGFAKNITRNFELLSRLDELKILERPVLVGISRKSMIWKTLGTDPQGALNGTTVLNTIALMKGANILRVHDVKEAMETVILFNKLEN